MKDNNTMAARAVLTCRPNSHPFQDRGFPLEQPVKIGRSVARSRPNGNNAIFDCKVLSRNHALLWYENGKFFLQDTKSSNGTFVNNQRLSKSSEESLPFQVSSGDILQFGVDVMEVTKKDPNNTDSMIDAVTHGCIVATLQLYLPDGKEAKASSSTQLIEKSQSSTLEIYQINQVVKEALQREQLIDSKLASLNQLLGSTKGIMANSWKALINEDRLLSKVDSLQRQLHATHKSVSEDKLREEITQLHEDKEKYQALAKQKLKDLAMEKLEAMKRINELERNLSATEEERTILKELCDRTNLELGLVAQKYDESEKKASDLLQEMNESTENYKNELDRLNKCVKDEEEALQKKQQMIDQLMAKLDSQNLNANPVKTLLVNNSSVDGDLNENDSVVRESDLNLTCIVNSQHNKNSLVEPQISANTVGDSNHVNNSSSTDVPPNNVDRVDTTMKNQHIGNELIVGGVDLQQLNNNLTDLLSRFDEFRKLHIDGNYSEAISQLITKVTRDVHQIKNITNTANLLLENQTTVGIHNQNSTTAVSYNKKTIELNRVGSDEQKDADEDEKKSDEDERVDELKRQKISGNHSTTKDDDDATLTQLLSESREQVTRLLNEKSALQERVETLGAYLTDYTRKYDVYKAEAEHLEQTNGEQALQLLALNERLSESERTLAEVEASLKTSNQLVGERDGRILNLRAELSALEEYKTEQDQRVDLLRSQIDDLSRATRKEIEETYQRNSTPKKNQSTVDSFNSSGSEHSSDLCEKRCSYCCNATVESQNEELQAQVNTISARLLETEEELCIYKDQFNKSSSEYSKLERQVLDQQSLDKSSQWTSIRYTVPLIIIILAILIVFHPST